MRTYFLGAIAALTIGSVSMTALADSNMTGRWVGQFNGIQIEIQPERGPFGYLRDEPKAVQTPRFVDKPLQFDIETENKGLVSGTWTSAEFKKHFVCAQVGQTAWNCIDAGGRASVEVLSPTELRLCYFDNREGAQGAGCATLRKAK